MTRFNRQEEPSNLSRIEAGAASARPSHGQDRNIMEVLKAEPHYKIFTAALEDLGLDEILRTSGPYTVFAPTDEAFQRVPKLACLLDNPERLRETLNRHIIWGYLDLQALGGIKKLSPIVGKSIRIQRKQLRIVDAEVVQPNLQAPNGMIHGVTRVFTEENYSALREAGATLEEALKVCSSKVFDALKTMSNGLSEAFHSKSEAESAHEVDDPAKTKPFRVVGLH